jgi:outer membrane lipoprotein SlyB
VATIAGAAGGAYAGNEIEKNQKKQSYWAVAIRMDNGATRNFTYTSKPAVNEGERVRLVEGGRRLALVAN